MKTSLKTIISSLFLAFSFACAGVDAFDGQSDDLQSNYEPTAQWKAVAAKASALTKNPKAVNLTGGLASTKRHYDWTWTVMGEDGLYVTLSASTSGVKVLHSEHRQTFVAPALFTPDTLTVDSLDALNLLAKESCVKPGSLDLGGPVAGAAIRWAAECTETKMLFVDAVSGKVAKN
ncbi:MAG: hypothetical protein JST92_07000 [Deltaproteobacteria bacterium]|nr:hypothetical protein [Deltaproteobacteria bacterium]